MAEHEPLFRQIMSGTHLPHLATLIILADMWAWSLSPPKDRGILDPLSRLTELRRVGAWLHRWQTLPSESQSPDIRWLSPVLSQADAKGILHVKSTMKWAVSLCSLMARVRSRHTLLGRVGRAASRTSTLSSKPGGLVGSSLDWGQCVLPQCCCTVQANARDAIESQLEYSHSTTRSVARICCLSI
jgi:hypothetical protein